MKTNVNSAQPLPTEKDDENADQNTSESLSQSGIPNLYLKYKNKANDPPKISKASQPPQFGQAELKDFPDGKASIWLFNVNGVNASINKGALPGLLEEAKPDILCLNESKTDLEKITQKGFYKVIPDGYEQHWNCSKTRRGYSGVTIFTRIKPI